MEKQMTSHLDSAASHRRKHFHRFGHTRLLANHTSTWAIYTKPPRCPRGRIYHRKVCHLNLILPLPSLIPLSLTLILSFMTPPNASRLTSTRKDTLLKSALPLHFLFPKKHS